MMVPGARPGGGGVEIDQVEEPTRLVLVVRRTVRMDELSEFFAEAFGRCTEAAHSAHMEIAGAPFAWYHGMPTATIDVAAGMPVEHVTSELPLGVDAIERPGGPAVVAIHLGPYETLQDSYRVLEEWMAERNLVPRHDMWEEYLTDPGAEPDQDKWQTRMVLPVANASSV
jgi:effector-binding domain-containing protein